MKQVKLLIIGVLLGIIISIFVDKATYKPVVEEYHISLVKDWDKTVSPAKRKYYERLLKVSE